MPEYTYRAVDPRGKIVTGTVNADSASGVKEYLKNQGFLPVRIESGDPKPSPAPAPAVSPAPAAVSFGFKKKIGSEALSLFCRQLAVITMSGVSIVKGLEIMAVQTPNKLMRAEVSRIHREVRTGRTVAEAMRDKESHMPPLLVSMIATGEASGSLDEVLRNMSSFYEREHRIKQKIKSASVYPVIMIVMAIGLIIFFFNFLLPNITTLIVASGGELPLITRVVIKISEFTGKYLLVILGGLAVGLIILGFYFKTPGGRLVRDRLVAGTPLLGNTLRNVATMRFARTAYTLVRSGLPLLQGLEYIRQNVGNALAEIAVEYAIEGLQKGETMAANLAKAGYFNPMAIQMISIGEETGELEKILEEMSDYFNQEADSGFDRLLALVEPAMLILIGSIISVVIISVMLPMMELVTHVKR